jgi:hypothetical protein
MASNAVWAIQEHLSYLSSLFPYDSIPSVHTQFPTHMSDGNVSTLNTKKNDFINLALRDLIKKQYKNLDFLNQVTLIPKQAASYENLTHSFHKRLNVYALYTKKQKNKHALELNFIDAFTKVISNKGLQMVFHTETFDTPHRFKLHIPIQETILKQKEILNDFNRSELRHYAFFKRHSERHFIRALEFHKDLNLHQHSIKSFGDTLEDLLAYITLYEHNRSKHALGRCEMVVDAKYKEPLIEALGLQTYKNRFYYAQKGFRGSLKRGNLLCFKFFKNDATLAQQTAKYLSSYVKKEAFKYLFNYLRIKNITYSSKTLFSKSFFAIIYPKLQKPPLRPYQNLAFFTEAYHKGDITLSHFYGSIKLEHERVLHRLNTYMALKEHYTQTQEHSKLHRVSHSLKKYHHRYKKVIDTFSQCIELHFKKEKLFVEIHFKYYTLITKTLYRKIEKIERLTKSTHNLINRLHTKEEKHTAHNERLEHWLKQVDSTALLDALDKVSVKEDLRSLHASMVEEYEASLACDPQLEINKQTLNQRENALFLSHPERFKNDFYLHSLNNLYYATMALEGVA